MRILKYIMVTIVVLNYNDSENTIKFVKRIINYSIINHIIIVDNCSTDNSVTNLSSYVDEKINLIVTNKNGGYGFGNNYGILYAIREFNSEYILISNPDVIFTEKTLIKLEEVLASNKDVAIVAPFMLSKYGTKENLSAWKIPSAFQYLLYSTFLLKGLVPNFSYNNIADWDDPIIEVECVAGSMLMVNSKIMKEYGMYDEDIFLYCEETVLGIKLSRAKYKTLILPKESFIHLHSVSINKSINSEIDRRRLMLNSRITVLKKYYHFGNVKTFFSKIFFRLSIFEYRAYLFFIKIFKNTRR